MQRLVQRALVGQHVGNALYVVTGLQIAVQHRLAQVAIHQSHLFAAFGHRHRQIDCHVALGLFRHGTGDDQRVHVHGARHKVQIGAQRLVGLHIAKGHPLIGDQLQGTVLAVSFVLFVKQIPHRLTPPGSGPARAGRASSEHLRHPQWYRAAGVPAPARRTPPQRPADRPAQRTSWSGGTPCWDR